MVQQLVGSSSLGLGKLIDGKNQFIHIRYSANANGLNMTTEIQADTKYIGIATNSSETAPTSPSDYSWGRFVGTPGASSYTWIRYSSNADGSNMTAIPNEETKYIGVAITSEDSAPTDYTQYSWALFKGSDGRGVKKTEVSYQKSTSGTVIPTGSWLASIPSISDGEYLWTRTLFFYTDGTTTSTYNVSRNGISGLGIARADVHYQKSTSGTTVPIGTWTVTIPAVEANEYLWTRTTITYTDDSTSVSYSVGKMGADGKDAQLLYLTASSQIQAFDEDDQPKTIQPITISAKLQNASGTATFVAIPYIGNTAQTPITLGGTGNDRTLLPSQWTDPKWTIVAITATLGSLTDTVSIHKLKDGEKGEDGADGSPGVGVESATITYAASTSGTVHPTDGWSETIPSVPSGQYLWTRTVWLYTNGMSETSYSVSMMGERGPQGPQGDQGNDGLPGKDGVGVRSTVITYGLSDSETTQPTSWSAQVPTLMKGKYLWTKTVWSYTDSTSETSYQKTYIARDGNDGTDGLPGKDGVGIRSTTITYAVSESGTIKPVGGWSTTVPAVPSGQYLWTRTVWTYTDDTSETGYSVAKMGERGPQGPQGLQGIQGPKGDQGIAGRPGADGLTSYTHIAYANSADGTKDFSVSDSNRIYIGVYVDFNATDSTSPSSYQWSLIKGADGADGAPGKPGADGRTPYFHTAYANSADGSSGFSTTDSNGKLYLGTCTDYTQADPTDYRAYTWVKIKGEQGPQGIQGPSGANGQSLYTWLKYADDANGSGMSEAPDGKKYIGLAYNRPIPTESSNPKDYTWSLIQGENGVNGIDGKTYYTWVKYADTSTGGGLSDNPTGKKYIGLAYNKTTATESTNPGDYQWALIKGDKGDQGIPGTPGADGRTPYFHTAWADSSDGREGFSTTVSLGKKYLGTYTDFTSADSTDPTKYKWTETSNAIEQEIAYAWSEDGKDRFTRVKPEPNIARLYSLLDWGTTVDGVPRSQVNNLKPTNVSSNEQRYTRTSTSNAYLLTSSQNTPDYSGMTDRSRTSYANYRIGDKILFSFDYKGPNNGVHVTRWRMSLDGSKITRKYIGTTTYRATLPDGYTRVWAYITVNEGDIDYAFEISSEFFGSAVGDSALIRNLRISKSNATDESIMPIYTTNPQDDYDNSTPRYIGRSLKDSTNPADFTWEPNPERKPWTAYAQGLNGEGFSLVPYGENFIRNSDFTNGLSNWRGNTSSFIISQESGDNLVTATITGQNSVGVKASLFGTTIPVKPNDYIIISGWFRGKAIESKYFFIAEAYDSNGGRVQYNDIVTNSTWLVWSTPVADNTWSKFYLRWKITNVNAVSAGFRYVSFHNGTYSYKKWKLEADTPDGKPTPWTPAPSEDPLGATPKYVGTAALPYTDYTKYAWTLNTDYTQDQIDQANENISNKVDQDAYDQDKSVIYDDINKKLDDEEFREFQKIMNELKGSYDSFVGEGGRYEQELKNSLEREQAIVKEFGNKVNQLNFINTYIRESEEGLVIGAKNSPMQMLLSKDSLSFMDGGQTVAYFSNQSFYINRGAVVESLQVGVHKLTKVGNEHTVIQYIPQ